MPKNLIVKGIDADEKNRIWPLNFLGDTEEIYRREYNEQNHKNIAIICIAATILFNFFLFSDYILTGQYFYIYLYMRTAFVDPLAILSIILMWRKIIFYDIAVSIISTSMAIGLSIALMASDGAYRSHYLFGSILLMMCGSVVGHLRITYVSTIVLIQYCIYLLVVFTTDFIPFSSKSVSILFGLVGAVIGIMTAYAMEKSSRRSFLLSLRVKSLNQALTIQAFTDPLTGLSNRRCFEQATERYWGDQSVNLQPVSIVLLDIDFFKLFNDNYGHSAGDLCLKRIAANVKAGLPDDEALAVRFGGEEMLLFLPGIDFLEARNIAEKIRLLIVNEAIPHPAVKPSSFVTASFGVATATAQSCLLSELISGADSALYAAKKNGRNQVWPPLTSVDDNQAPLSLRLYNLK